MIRTTLMTVSLFAGLAVAIFSTEAHAQKMRITIGNPLDGGLVKKNGLGRTPEPIRKIAPNGIQLVRPQQLPSLPPAPPSRPQPLVPVTYIDQNGMVISTASGQRVQIGTARIRQMGQTLYWTYPNIPPRFVRNMTPTEIQTQQQRKNTFHQHQMNQMQQNFKQQQDLLMLQTLGDSLQQINNMFQPQQPQW